jgi:hypothetical protein
VKDLTLVNEGNEDWEDQDKSIINGRKMALIGLFPSTQALGPPLVLIVPSVPSSRS